jgi:hypothetical protein
MKKILTLTASLSLIAIDSIAQGCSVCTKTASGLGAESAEGLNTGILYLAALPLTFLATVGYIWYKRNRANI